MKYFYIFIFSCFCLTFTAQDIVSNLVICMPMDGNAQDMSGNNNNGSIVSCTPALDRFNNPNSCLQFAGNPSKIIVPASPSINNIETQNALTVAFWAKITSFGPTNAFPVCNKYNPISSWGWDYTIQPPQTWNGQIFVPNYNQMGGNYAICRGNEGVTLNQWDFYAITFSTANSTFRVYKNSNLLATVNTSTYTLEATGNNSLYIGYSPAVNADYAIGFIDDFKMYSRALTQTEITMLYTTTICPCMPATPLSIAGPTALCAGANSIYSIAPVNGAVSYSWTLPNGWSGSSSTNTISTLSGSTGIISVVATNSCGSSPSSSVSVFVGAPVSPGSIFGSTYICVGSSSLYSVSPVQGATSYSWALPNGWSGNSITNTINATAGSSGIFTVYAINSCGSSTATLSVNANTIPSAPTAINGNTSVCQGISGFYSVTPVPGASSYSWSLPQGWSGNSITNVISALSGSLTGVISVQASNICGTSPSASLAVNVIPLPPSPAPIFGSSLVCSGSQLQYSVAPVNGVTSYTWTAPNGWLGSSSTNMINLTATGSSGTIYVIGSNACGSSPAAALAVSVTTYPSNPGSISGPTLLCIGANAIYSIAVVPGATSYSWTTAGGLSGSSSSNTIAVTASAGGSLTVLAANFCGQSTAFSALQVSVQIAPSSPQAISGSMLMCAGTSSVFSVAPVAGATSYSWTLPNGWTGSSNSNSINATAGMTAGTITVTAVNACGTSSGITQYVDVNDCVSTSLHDNKISSDDIKVFPIPATGSLFVELSSAAQKSLDLYNCLGELIYTSKLTTGINEISVIGLPEGIYFLKIKSTSNKQFLNKIVISH
jgi:hypothetical protein